jgi:hypothetical protein
MKMLPVKYYQNRARVFLGLIGFCMLAYFVFRVLAELL